MSKAVLPVVAATCLLAVLSTPAVPAAASGSGSIAHPSGATARQSTSSNGPSSGTRGSGAAAGIVSVDDADSAPLRHAVNVAGILQHERTLQSIANRNHGNRASGTHGYTESTSYVVKRLRKAGYDVRTQKFTFPFFQELGPATLTLVAPSAASLPTDTFTFSGSGTVEGPVVLADGSVTPSGPSTEGTAGCSASDFTRPARPHTIALVQRGTCDYDEKVANAEAAGYAAVVIFDDDRQTDEEGPLAGVLERPARVPVVGLDTQHGEALADAVSGAAAGNPLVVRVSTTTTIDPTRSTTNIIADSPRGKTGQTVVVGAHLDSVLTGPGINDNGSGTATTLEIAEQMAKLGYTRKVKLQRQVRFTFFAAEEDGLLGSQHYVDSLSDAQRAKIYAYLNYDMLGSPNYARFRYAAAGQPPGSAAIEQIFTDYFTREGLPTSPVSVADRADHASFAAAGIPVGGLFSGAESTKTRAEAQLYGGTAGTAYDACYHKACDTIAGQNLNALNQLSDGAAHAVYVLTQTSTGLFPDASRVPTRTTRRLHTASPSGARG